MQMRLMDDIVVRKHLSGLDHGCRQNSAAQPLPDRPPSASSNIPKPIWVYTAATTRCQRKQSDITEKTCGQLPMRIYFLASMATKRTQLCLGYQKPPTARGTMPAEVELKCWSDQGTDRTAAW